MQRAEPAAHRFPSPWGRWGAPRNSGCLGSLGRPTGEMSKAEVAARTACGRRAAAEARAGGVPPGAQRAAQPPWGGGGHRRQPAPEMSVSLIPQAAAAR